MKTNEQPKVNQQKWTNDKTNTKMLHCEMWILIFWIDGKESLPGYVIWRFSALTHKTQNYYFMFYYRPVWSIILYYYNIFFLQIISHAILYYCNIIILYYRPDGGATALKFTANLKAFMTHCWLGSSFFHRNI